MQCYGQPGVGRTPGFNSLVTPDRLQSLWDFYSCQFHGLCGNGAGTFGGGFPGGGVFGSRPCGEYCLNWGADWETAHEAALILWPGYDLGTCISSSGDCGIIDWTLAGVGIIPGGKGVSSLGKAAIKAGSKVLASRAARAGSQFTRSTLELGQQMHRAYKSDLVNGVTRFKEFVFNTGRRADFIDLEKGTIYELKPNNPRAIREGYKQLEQYLQDARAQFPDIDWTTVLDTY